MFAGCGGKDAVAPVDVEKQAWEDLRSEVRETVSDPARQAEVIHLVDVLAEDVKVFREVMTKRHDARCIRSFPEKNRYRNSGEPAAGIENSSGIPCSDNAGGVVTNIESTQQSDGRHHQYHSSNLTGRNHHANCTNHNLVSRRVFVGCT